MYGKLVKLFLKENFSLKRIFGFDYKKAKVKGILIGLAIIYGLVVFIGAFGWLFFDLGKILSEIGQTHLILSFLTIYSIGLSIIISFFRASGSLFHYKDYEILSPLPIHPRVVLSAKMTVLLITLYVSSFIFTLPIVFSYFYWNGFSIIGFIAYLIGFIALPLVPVVAMSLFSLGITLITARFRKSKLLSIILMFAFFIALFLWSFSINESTVNPLTGQIDLFAGISRVYFPITWFTHAIHDGNLIELLYLLLTHVAILGMFVYFIQGVVNHTNQRGLRQNIKKNGKPVKYQEKSVVMVLVQKELKKFFSIPLYAVNSGLGPVILVVLSIGSLFYRTQIEGFLSNMIGTGLQIELLLLILIGFSVAMTYTPAISLSLEGKNFWIVKSLPIPAHTIMISKVLFNLFLIIPIAVMSILLFGFSIQIIWYNQLLLMMLIILFGILISLMDSVVNLYMPKFDFVNEVEVIKQSAGALVGIFGGFGLMAINGVVYYFTVDWISFPLQLVILSVVNALMIIPFGYIIKFKSQELFNRMKA
jgi:ABC-2 type transport system permease protein